MIVPIQILQDLAATAPHDTPKSLRSSANPDIIARPQFDVARFLYRNNLDVSAPSPWNGGTRWTFNSSPMCEHHGDGPFIIQHESGAISAGCQHASCRWKWSDLRQKVEPKAPCSSPAGEVAQTRIVNYRRITSAELANGNYTVEYLVEGVLVAKQPAIFAGPQKSLKTGTLIDLTLSLASAGRWLGRFPVSRPVRSAVMTGESGLATIQETARRQCAAKDIQLAALDNLIWSDDLPKFGDLLHLSAIERFIRNDGIEVIIVDPAYLAMPSADAGNLMAQGELLRGVAEICQSVGATLVLAHHTKKHTGRDPHEPLELPDIAWSGFAEFARQWLLINRREPYEPGTGLHRMWLSIGGSAGHGGLWAVDVDEGTRDTPGGRYWDVRVSNSAEARQQNEQRKADGKARKAEQQVEADLKAVIVAMAKLPGTRGTKSDIRDRVSISSTRLNSAIADAIDRGLIVEADLVKGNNRTYGGYKIAS